MTLSFTVAGVSQPKGSTKAFRARRSNRIIVTNDNAKCKAWERAIAPRDWTEMLLVAHGVTNRVILAWVLGLPLGAIGRFEQDSCCLNVIDLDTAPDGAIKRRFLRTVNLTATDAAKVNVRRTTVENLALRYLMNH